MPRTYNPRMRQYKKYDVEAIRIALREYESSNCSLAEISAKHNISKSVLHRHNTRYMKKQGGQTVLSAEEEAYIIANINYCSEWGYPLDTYDLRMLVKGYLDRLGVNIKKFKDNLPGPDFVKSFLNRNRDKVSLRISQNIKRPRAAVSRDVIEQYFYNLEKSIAGVPLCNIVNYDETNLSDDPGRRKVLTKRGAKYPERVMNHSKASTSLMMAASADGLLLPCYVVYKAKNLYESWVEQGPKGCRYNCTSSGWFDSNTFEDWVRTIAFPYFKGKYGKKFLIGDNLSSHLSLDLIRECKEKDVHFIFLPPNSTHLTQPLDVAFFRPTKEAWRNILYLWKKTDGRTLPTIPKSVFPNLLKKLITRIEVQAMSNILAGFMKTGISPLNKNKVLERLPGSTMRDEENFRRDAIDETVIGMLKEMRYGNGTIKTSNKRKKINVKPGRSVSADNGEDESDIESEKEFDSEDNHEAPPRYQAQLNDTQYFNKENEGMVKKCLTAKQIPEERKRKFEAKFEKTKSEITKLNTEPNDIEIFKKPYDMKKYKKIRKQENRILPNDEEALEIDFPYQIDQFPDKNEFDIATMPIHFDDNFCLQEEIEISGMFIDNKEKPEEVSNLPRENKIRIKSVENFETKEKIKIDLKNVKKIAFTDKLNRKIKSRPTKYYSKDEEILRDLMNDDIN